MARKHTQLAKSRLLQYTEIQATSIPAGTTVYEVATLPSTVDVSKDFIYVTETAKYYRIKPKEPGQYNASTEENGVMMGEPAVNVASGYEAIFVHKYPNTGSSIENNGLSVYKPITESIDLDTSSMYTPTAQAVSKFVLPEYNTTVTSSTPTILLKENVAFQCTNAGVTSVTLNVSDVYGVTTPKTRETRVYFHTGSNPTTLSLTGTGSSSMTVIGDNSLLPDKDYVVSVKDNTVVINTDPSSVLYEEVTYSQLVTKINNSRLVKGRKYRITDYVTTTTQSNTSSAGHVFDLVVTAIDVNELDCNASALLHSGDTYFSTAGADLSKWQIWYDVNNDTTKYAWADTTNGKGVIYRMIDEWRNDCPYDFKNILFTKTNMYTSVYTFNKFASGDTANSDYSLTGYSCQENVIKGLYYKELNFIVILNGGSANEFSYTSHDIVLRDGCSYNVFEAECYDIDLTGSTYNFFAYGCATIVFGNNCSYNTIGRECYDVTFYNYCQNNKLGGYDTHIEIDNNGLNNNIGFSCSDIYIGVYCYYNTLGDYCNNVILSGNCQYNIFGGDCNEISLSNACYNVSIGGFCTGIVVGNSSNQGGDYCKDIIIEKGNKNIRIYNTSSPSASNYLQNIYIAQGCSGTSSAYTEISTIARNLSYRTTVGRDSSGNIRIYNEDDPASASQAQANWNETSSSSPSYIQNKPDLDATLYEEVTYSQLRTKIDNEQLVEGKKYRITDYVTLLDSGDNPSVSSSYKYKSAQYPFDLVVTATSASTLDCCAQAVLHDGDTYFNAEKLSKLKIWYSVIGSDVEYAHPYNGKGCIYRMVDEFGNDCPYDFHNVMFKRKVNNGVYDEQSGTLAWLYTFDSGFGVDVSFNAQFGNNVIKPYIIDDEGGNMHKLMDGTVFLGNGWYNNTIGFRCTEVTIGDTCSSNIIGNDCTNIVLINSSDNVIGAYVTVSRISNLQKSDIGPSCGNLNIGSAGSQTYFYNIIVAGGNNSLSLVGDGNGEVKYVYIEQGVSGTVTLAGGLLYGMRVGKQSDGSIRIYNEDDPQVQANWNETNFSSPSYIQNKPTIPAAQVNSDWNASSGVAQILNKPTIPDVLEDLTDVVYDYEGKYIPNALTDYDGNSYGAVILGDQVWMAENLRTTHYADGTAVTYKDMSSSQFTLQERGLFYNWPAVMNGASSSTSIPSGVQGIAPTGWHVPSKQEFIKLNNYLQTRPDYWIGDPQNTAKSMASQYGWAESTTEYAVGNDQSLNNNSSLNLIPVGSFQNNTVYGLDYAIISNTTLANGSNTYINPFILGANSVSPALTALYSIETFFLNVRCIYDGTPEQFIRMLMNKQVLVYDSSKQAWVNKNVAEALPSMNGNSGKVLAVNSGATGVEWVTQTAAQVNSDWDASSGVAQILNKPSLATVATSGSYNDLSNKPTIPTEVVYFTWTLSGGVYTSSMKPADILAALRTETKCVIGINPPIVHSARNEYLLYHCMGYVENSKEGTFELFFTHIDGSDVYSLYYDSSISTWNYFTFRAQELLIGTGTGQNIKTINNTSLLGSGNINIPILPTYTNNAGKVLMVNSNETDVEWFDQKTYIDTNDVKSTDQTYFPKAVQDYEGHWYDAVIIGDQVWMVQNLQTKYLPNGTAITGIEGYNATTPDYVSDSPRWFCYVYDNYDYINRYGLLYNWYATMNGSTTEGDRGIAPSGWHIPTKTEFDTLLAYLRTKEIYINSNGISKALSSQYYWFTGASSNFIGTNTYLNNMSGWSGTPGGRKSSDLASDTNYVTYNGYWWTSTPSATSGNAVSFTIGYSTVNPIYHTSSSSVQYRSVRCICDKTPLQFREWYYHTYGTIQHTLDYMVSQNATSTDATYNLLLKNSADNTDETNAVKYSSGLNYNPSINLLTNAGDIISDGDVRVKGNDLYIGSATTTQCHQQYDNTNKCLKFIFD